MEWSDLKKWIFLRGVISGTLIGGFFSLAFNGIQICAIIGIFLGGAVGAATGITLTQILRYLVLSYPNIRITRYIVTTLFVSLNLLFTFILFEFPFVVSSNPSLGNLIARTFGIIPAVISTVPAFYLSPSIVDQVIVMQAGINARRLEDQSQ